MENRARRATAVGATAFVLAGSAVLGMPGTASAAETKTVPCGSTVTAKPGDKITGSVLGIPTINLGIVTEGTKVLTGTLNAILGTLCQVTVNVVNTVVSPLPGVGAPAASAINQSVQGLTSGTQQGLNTLTGGGKQQSPAPGTGGNPQQPPAQGGTGGAPQGGTPQGTTPIPDANSPLLPGFATSPVFGGFPFSVGSGYAPMRDYGGIPFATAGLFTPSPHDPVRQPDPGLRPAVRPHRTERRGRLQLRDPDRGTGRSATVRTGRFHERVEPAPADRRSGTLRSQRGPGPHLGAPPDGRCQLSRLPSIFHVPPSLILVHLVLLLPRTTPR